MYKNSFQHGCFTVFVSLGSDPLNAWSVQKKNGHVKRIMDEDIKSTVYEIMGTNVSTTSVTTPKDPRMTLGIRLPFLMIQLKNINQYFAFEIKILDDTKIARRIHFSNFQTKTSVKTFSACMPVQLAPGWNQLNLNLETLIKQAYNTEYKETLRIQINANTRLRRIFFSDRLFSADTLPMEVRLSYNGYKNGALRLATPQTHPPLTSDAGSDALTSTDNEESPKFYVTDYALPACEKEEMSSSSSEANYILK